jgi:hypothetical protein
MGSSVTARITNTESKSRSGLLQITIFDASGARIGQVAGAANDVAAGSTATVTFIGTTDTFPGDPATYTYELQDQGSY